MTHSTKASQLPGDGEEVPEVRTYAQKPAPEIQGNDDLLRTQKPEGIQRTARELAEGQLGEFTVERDNNRPLRFQGQLIGFNDADPEAPRGTSVAIFATRRGKIVTSVHQWQRDTKRERERHDAAAHDRAEDALEWLVRDGGGQLGRASREAWERACTSYAPLQGHDVEVVE